MANTQPITELDFDSIKADIITFIKSNPTFSDYSFEGSALNAIADMLAYNTHTNAYYANMLHSEGFIDTAQKRSSVVSRAKELGYTPMSASCSAAYVNITVAGAASAPSSLLLHRGDTFTSSNENGSYSFVVANDTAAAVVGADQVFSQVKLVNGTNIQNTFPVDTTSNIRSMFTIPNKNIDISTLRVFVLSSPMSIDRVEYFNTQNVFSLTPTSNSYFIQESYDGFFQIYFGNDVIGKQPVNGNVINADYMLTSDYDTANGCHYFGFSGTIGSFSTIAIETTQVSFGGSDKESLASIKDNAIKKNSSQGRTVTVTDYEASLLNNYPFIKSVSIWGGENNVPPVYGKVFISVQPASGFTISDSIKADVLIPELRKSSMMTIIPEIVDPNYISLEFVTRIKFNPSTSTSTQYAVEGSVRDAVSAYISDISSFNKDYLQSTLISRIIGSNVGIVSANISKFVGFKIAPLIGVPTTFYKNVGNEILGGSVKSTKFNVLYSGVPTTVTVGEITDKLTTITTSTGAINDIQAIGLYSGTGTLIQEIGTVNLSTGEFTLTFTTNSYVSSISSYRFIQINCRLVLDDISTSKNQILMLDTLGQDPSIGLLSNNQVITDIYGK